MKSIYRGFKNSWYRLTRMFRFQSKFLLFWKDPAKSFFQSHARSYLTFDRSKTKFKDEISFWRKPFLSQYYKVYFNTDEKIVGYKSIMARGPVKLTTQAQRFYSLNEINDGEMGFDENKDNPGNQDIRLDLVYNFTNEIDNLREEDVFLWEIRKIFDLHHPKGKTQYFYSNSEFLVEYLDKFQIRGIFVEGNNISLDKAIKSSQYLRKLKDFQGNYNGYDEISHGKVRNSLRLFFNEDGILTLTNRFALVNEKRHLRELSRYDSLGNKINSELYEDEKLQKSAVFFYNEDRKLVKIIQYGPDGNILNS